MKKALLASILSSTLIMGCASTSDETAGSHDRSKAISALTVKMDELGYEKVKIQPGVDEFLNLSAAILKRQRNVMKEYYHQSETYRDVQSFLFVNKDKNKEELAQAIAEFDAGAKTDDEKIGHKIALYQQASEKVFDSNVELGLEITKEVAQSAIILSQHGTEVAKATALRAAGSLFSSFTSDDKKKDDSKDLGSALLKAKDQLSLAMDANKIISTEQDIVKAIEALQAEHESRGKKL
ncbi:hypothetical protein [Parashewanella tropica]|uniref:hypothetical protein n=1 Tax=Parashewanella tropica TaxID=2547970 RepID=UPI00105979DF|nr:hypothetical protein [Parashewanella tropica]